MSKEVWEADDYIATLKKITEAEYNDPRSGLLHTPPPGNLFQVLENWLLPLDEEVPKELEEEEEGSSDNKDEVAEVASPVPAARKTRMQKQREIEASRSLEERDSDDANMQEHNSRCVATSAKPARKLKLPAKKPVPKPVSPPRSVAAFESDEETGDEEADVSDKIPEDSTPMKGSETAEVVVESAVLLAVIAPTVSAAPEPGDAENMGSMSPPPEGAPVSPGTEVPTTATSTSKKLVVSWAASVFEKGLTRRLGPELEKPAHISTGLHTLPVAMSGVKKIGRPSVAKDPPADIEGEVDPSKKRKATEVKVSGEGVKRKKESDSATKEEKDMGKASSAVKSMSYIL